MGTSNNNSSSNWFMYHGGYNHGGYVDSASKLTSANVNEDLFGLLKSVDLEGSILSVPAIVDGFIFVGVANSHNKAVIASNGGTLYKLDITTGTITAQYSWQLAPGEGDSHGFYGMGCTPAVINNKVYFSAFNGRVYCLNQEDLSHVWDTDLRNADPSKNQPVSNTSKNIVSNIFANPNVLKNYLTYIAGLASQALDQVTKYFIKENFLIGKQLEILAKKLDEANNNDNLGLIKILTEKIIAAIAEGIGLSPRHFEKFLQKILPDFGLPAAAGWCSPIVVNFENNDQSSSKLYVGVAEGENPLLFGFIFALDANNGKVDWIYCTNQNEAGTDNPPNQLPLPAIGVSVEGYDYTMVENFPQSMACSVWSAIAYDDDTGLIYASTGNPQPDGALPTKGYSNGILALKAVSGDFSGFCQMPKQTAYRDSDIDVDIASACTLFELDGKKVVGVSCKNGGFMVCDANTLKLINFTSLLPTLKNGSRIAQIDIHPPPSLQNEIAPNISNEVSDANHGENYCGPFNTAAIHPPSENIFIGMGGPNYHNPGPGIDFNTTPFMKAINMRTLKDSWPMDDNDPPRYLKTGKSMYTNALESGLSSPAVVNDVVFCSTTNVSIYAFKVADGTLLWSRDIGSQTFGFNGGYGYCLGPAIWKDYVVACALVLEKSGGILEIYGLKNAHTMEKI